MQIAYKEVALTEWKLKMIIFDLHSLWTVEALQRGWLFILCGFITPLSEDML